MTIDPASPSGMPPSGAPTPTAAAPSPQSGNWIAFFRRFFAVAGAYWTAETRWRARGLTAGLVALTLGQVMIPVILNKWNLWFFDALEKGAMDRFLIMVGALALIIAANVAITVTHLNVRRRLQVDWRAWLTHRIMGQWGAEGRHYLLDYVPGEHDNPDGRIAEDIRNATEFAVDLAHSLTYCLLLLASFITILWDLSGHPVLTLGGVSFSVPGHLVWIAFLYAGLGAWVAWLLGGPLVGAQKRRQRSEATFRFGLAHMREHSLEIALLNGARNEGRTLRGLFRVLMGAWNLQTSKLMNYEYFLAIWSVLTMVFPILVAAPRYILGSLTLGGLMQTAQGFQQLVGSLSWPIDNMGRLADWRASAERVLGIRDALDRLDVRAAPEPGKTIEVERGDAPVLIFDTVTITDPAGAPVDGTVTAEIVPGQRILVTGESLAAFRFLKVAAGLWPWGNGRVRLPVDGPIVFVPQKPYLPLRSLRATVTYPRAPVRVKTRDIESALRQVSLDHLIGDLDRSDHWNESLTADEQQRISFARLLLVRPRWIFIQEALDGFDKKGRRDMLALLDTEFADAAIVVFGHHPDLETFATHVLDLSSDTAEARVLPLRKT